MQKIKLGNHDTFIDISESQIQQLTELLNKDVPKKSFLAKFGERTFNNLGTTVAGISLHYDLVINGFVTKDYIMLGKGVISILAMSYCEDPKFKNQTEPLETQ